MADFTALRNDLNQGRASSDHAQLELKTSKHRLNMLEQERKLLERQKGDNNESYLSRRNELDEKIRAEKAQVSRREQHFKAVNGRLAVLEHDFEIFTDPRRELAAHFSNETPFLLFPLRMETRFKTNNSRPQLWVRVYPDECMVDSFDPLLSENEVNNAARFWAEYYGAGNVADPANPDPAVVDLQRAAWALLAGATGEGRAAWITQELRPDTTRSVFPLRTTNSVILAIATDSWDTAQQPKVFDLLIKLWFADRNQALINQIKADFNAANPTLDADKLFTAYRPVNFDAPLPIEIKKRSDALPQIAVAVFNELDKKAGKEHGWSQASRANILPERFALIRYKSGKPMEPLFGNSIPHPLPTSPDPSVDAEEQFKQTPQGDLEFADAIKWVADFDRAVSIGMGFRIDLAADEINGFEKLLVLGVRLGSDETKGQQELEELIDHHYFSKKGCTLLPQGTPTNNTGAADSGYSTIEDPAENFERYFNRQPAFNENTDPPQKRDGQCIAELLGVEYDIFRKVLHSETLDQADARNMNTALWPATMGYVMESLMQGGFSADTLSRTRSFFNQYVSGRGPVPAIRIGNQPYGILPTAAFHRLQWMYAEPDRRFHLHNDKGQLPFLKNLYELLLKMHAYWKNNFLSGVPHVGRNTATPYQQLLDILSLHPNSVEFHRRYLESLIEMSNKMSIIKPGFKLNQQVVINAINLLHDTLGYTTDTMPQLAALLAMPWEIPIKHLVDDQPLSEVNGIRDYTADKRNYLEALVDQANKSENALRTGEGLLQRPSAELYRLLKYALELGYHKTAVDVAEERNAFNQQQLAVMRTEQAFAHQSLNDEVIESRYALLYDTVPAISQTKTVAAFVRDSLFEAEIPSFSRYLSSQINALANLKDASTARLERALVEHLDCCNYRLDAWETAIITNQLTTMRNNHPGTHWENRRTGIYIGAFGWLENVRPEKNKVLTPKEVPAELKDDFNPEGKKAFVTDAANEGYIHAPSLNQAVTAAVLRNGYVSHGKPEANNVLAVNLTSERIRLALSVIEGIQAGQTLAALLGYHFERTLHNRSDLTAQKIDSYIYAIRKLFPLNADKLKETSVKNTTDPSVDPETVPITAIEARNVVHGVNLINHVKKQVNAANRNYPFALTLPSATPVIANAITATVQQLIEIADAVADLGMAESVHHVVMGNYDRAAGVLESYTKGNYPQEPDVIRTPRSGPTLTHRVGLPFTYVALNTAAGPRAQSEPSVNQWLTTILPPLNTIVCKCSYISRADGLKKTIEVALNQIGLEPIDLIYILNAIDAQALNELDDRLLFHLQASTDVTIDSEILFNYLNEPAAGKFSVFQLMPLVRSLKTLITESVPLTPGDISLPNEVDKKELPLPELNSKRSEDLINKLKTDLNNAAAVGGIVHELLNLPEFATATETQLNTIRQQADTTMQRFAAFLITLGSYGVQQTGIGAIYTTRQQWYLQIKKKIKEVTDRWQKKSDDYALLAVNPSPTEEELLNMERLISSTTTPGVTLAVVQGKKLLFDATFNALKGIHDTRYSSTFALTEAVRLINLSPFDTVPPDITDELRQISLFIYDLQARAKSLTSDLNKRIVAAEAIISGLGTLSATDQVKQVEAAATLILGEQFKMFPRYALPASLQAEIGNSWNDTGSLLNHLKTTAGRFNPLEDWLHGIARVHPKMKHLENCILSREAFDLNEAHLSIHPVQLPYKSEKYHWMAMPFPIADVDMEEGNTLLYTAFTASAAAAPAEVCGALVDEWTELIPSTEETTGISFHYDRPNCESPQTLLLVAPTKLTGNWDWNDLVDALLYTLEAAKIRAVSPEQIEKTPFTTFLPAVIGAESLFPYSIVLDNKVHYKTEAEVRNFSQPI